MTGQALFDAHVKACLCFGVTYEWDKLTPGLQRRWEDFAATVSAGLAAPALPKDIDYLLEAYKYGQFSDDMLDHPSPDCRAPCQPVREALRRHLDWLQTLADQQGGPRA